jgi:hypothetical protein
VTVATRPGPRGWSGPRPLARALAVSSLLALAAGAASCGGRGPDPASPDPAGLDDPGATEADDRDPPPRPRHREGEVSRAGVDRVLDAGPGAFLASIEVRARTDRGRFTGWVVVRVPWPDVDLLPGDVVLGVNGRALEHPAELKLLWEDLRRAPAIEAEVERRGERFALRFTIAPPAP